MNEDRLQDTKWKGQAIPAETLREILDQHKKWNETQTEEGERADLSGADLGGVDLSGVNLLGANLYRAILAASNLRGADLFGANLRKANLSESNLVEVDLSEASLREADLRGANLSDAKLIKANLSMANLYGANLTGGILWHADMIGADLQSSNLAGAQLDGAKFLRATLTNATMTAGETYSDPTVAGTEFGMADLTGAKLPAPLKEFADTLKNVEETSKNARAIFLGLIGLCAYALLATATTIDGQLVLNHFHLKLPIIGAEVSVLLFYIAAPLLAFVFFLYLHVYLAHLWELMAGLPAFFSDGLPLRRKVYPWIFNLVVEWWQNEKSTLSLPLFRTQVAILLGWALFPLTVGAMAYRVLVRHDPWLSYPLAGLFAISCLISSVKYEHARALVRSAPVGGRWLVPGFVFLLSVGLGGYGTYLGLAGKLPFTTAKVQLRGVNLEGKVFGKADLTGADLSFAKLKQADLRGAILRGVDLHGADLTSADISSKDKQANMENAILKNAILQNATLIYANLQWAKLEGADLRKADLTRANLEWIKAREIDLTGAVMIDAKLKEAALVDSILKKAYLLRANLSGTLLIGVDLSGAFLREATGLTQAQLNRACADKTVHLPEGFEQPPKCSEKK